jgi:predicted amidohydrolase YtcJ
MRQGSMCPEPHRPPATRRNPCAKSDLDPLFPDNPVLLIHNSNHGAVLNSRALALVGYDANTPDPAGKDLAAVQYHLLPVAFGRKGWLTAKVATVKELEAVLAQIHSADYAAYIEVLIPGEESQLLPKQKNDQRYKLQIPLVD